MPGGFSSISRSPDSRGDSRGFTLIEMMISVGLVSVILFALGVTTLNFGQSSMSFRRSVPAAVEREQFQDFFSKLAEAAWVSTKYLHEPVSWSTAAGGSPCSAAGDTNPCIRRQGYNEAGTFVGGETTFQEVTTAAPANTYGAYIDFFRDESSTLTVRSVYPNDAGNALQLSSGSQDYISAALEAWTQTDYFATWRLDNTNSAPFFILSQYPSRNAFILSGRTANRTFTFTPTDPGMIGATAPAPANRTALAAAIQTGLMLVYNSEDPRQYTIQYIKSATPGPGTTSFTIDLEAVNLNKNGGNPIGTTPTAWYREGSIAANAYNPSVSGVNYTWGANGMYWGATQQDSNFAGFYLFPSQFFSFASTQSAATWGGTQPFAENPATQGVDIWNILTYYSTASPLGPSPINPVPQLIGIPLVATAFFLGTGVLPRGCAPPPIATPVPGCPSTANYYSLQSISLPGPVTRTHISMVSPSVVAGTAPVYFGRRLGTSKIEVFVK